MKSCERAPHKCYSFNIIMFSTYVKGLTLLPDMLKFKLPTEDGYFCAEKSPLDRGEDLP